MPEPVVGVLAIQGDVQAHGAALERADLTWRPIRYAGETAGLAGLVLPGGETSTMIRGLEEAGLWEEVAAFGRAGKPVLATCAGLILVARQVTDPAQSSMGILDVDVTRNAYGRHVDSFIDHVPCPAISPDPIEAVFIRAPRIQRTGPEVEVLAARNGEPVLVSQGAVVGAAFHPELSPNSPVHAWWAERVRHG